MINSKHFLLIFSCFIIFLFTTAVSFADIKKDDNMSATEKLKSVNPDLYRELHKLPELKANTIKNANAIEKISRLALSNENKEIFQIILNEGIKEKRKFCTPLQALLWISYDKDLNKKDEPWLRNFSLSSLILEAWTETSTSTNLFLKRWKNFNEVTDRLNSPQIIAIFMQKRMYYSYKKREFEGVKSAKKIFTDSTGACYDHALFASYLLKRNGYVKAWGTAVKFDHLVDNFYSGHIGNIFQDPKDNLFYSMDFNSQGYYCVFGPYSTIKEAAAHICYVGSKGMAQLKSYKTYEIDLKKGKYKKLLPYF